MAWNALRGCSAQASSPSRKDRPAPPASFVGLMSGTRCSWRASSGWLSGRPVRCLSELESNATWCQIDAKHYELFHPDRGVQQRAPRGPFKPVAFEAQQRLPAALALEAWRRPPGSLQRAKRRAHVQRVRASALVQGGRSRARPPYPGRSRIWPKCWRPRWTQRRKTWGLSSSLKGRVARRKPGMFRAALGPL